MSETTARTTPDGPRILTTVPRTAVKLLRGGTFAAAEAAADVDGTPATSAAAPIPPAASRALRDASAIRLSWFPVLSLSGA